MNIVCAVAEHVNVQIIVYDILGKQIETLINELQTLDYYSANCDADNHPNSIYIVKIAPDYYISTQKLMLVK